MFDEGQLERDKLNRTVKDLGPVPFVVLAFFWACFALGPAFLWWTLGIIVLLCTLHVIGNAKENR